jgi:hypothetical protein
VDKFTKGVDVFIEKMATKVHLGKEEFNPSPVAAEKKKVVDLNFMMNGVKACEIDLKLPNLVGVGRREFERDGYISVLKEKIKRK